MYVKIVNIIKKRNIRQFFKDVVGSPPAKGEITRAIVENCAFNRDEIVMVGDAMEDLKAARGACIRFVARVSSPASRLNRENDIIRIPDLHYLGDVLGLR